MGTIPTTKVNAHKDDVSYYKLMDTEDCNLIILYNTVLAHEEDNSDSLY